MIVYAVNVHTGGGKVLLDELLSGRPFGPVTALFYDKRYTLPDDLSHSISLFPVNNTIFSRLTAEFALKRFYNNSVKTPVLFFGNLPPLFFKPFTSILYLQNCFLLPGIPTFTDTLKASLRLQIEKFLLRTFIKNTDQIWVQTKWMANMVKKMTTHQIIEIKPFTPLLPMPQVGPIKTYDFLNVTSLSKHKNLNFFLDSLVELDTKLEMNISILVVLDNDRHDALKLPKFEKISLSLKFGLDRQQVLEAYQISKVAVVTSLYESFCLPLHEALHFNLPVICIDRPYAQIESDRISLYSDTESLVSKMLMFAEQTGPKGLN